MHHTRRKSGHGSTNTSMSDVRKAVTVSDLSRPRRPQTLSRKSTPQTLQKLGKTQRSREKELEEERWWEEERESFPQFCMTCEKQFIPQDERYVYCSEACRKYDQGSSPNPSAYPIPRTQDILGGTSHFTPPGIRSRETSSPSFAFPPELDLLLAAYDAHQLAVHNCYFSSAISSLPGPQVRLRRRQPVQVCGLSLEARLLARVRHIRNQPTSILRHTMVATVHRATGMDMFPEEPSTPTDRCLRGSQGPKDDQRALSWLPPWLGAEYNQHSSPEPSLVPARQARAYPCLLHGFKPCLGE
ncbi:hypothetical protein PG995_000780 [Apiospora arundinis]